MYCEHCGAADMTGNFCRKCGNRLANRVNDARPKPQLLTATEYISAKNGSQMTFIEAVSICLKKYADFTGRANRAEYWWFALFNLLVYVVVLFILMLSGTGGTASAGQVIFFYLPLLGLIVPNLSVTIRRLHDAGHPGTYFFFSFIPFVGPFIILIFALQKSEEFDHEFGK